MNNLLKATWDFVLVEPWDFPFLYRREDVLGATKWQIAQSDFIHSARNIQLFRRNTNVNSRETHHFSKTALSFVNRSRLPLCIICAETNV